MNRRELIGSGAALLVTAAAAKAIGAPAPAKDPHAGHGETKAGEMKGGAMNHGAASPLSDAAAQCIKSGEACLQHCLDMFTMGDTTMAGCAKAVSDMLATAKALFSLQLAGSKHAKAAAKLAADAAKDCEAECKKFTHAPCKACAECCNKLIAEAAKI
ncbi:MAG: Csp1 family four helix bundle copper storage protein [Deltaproteobacteria bacterium]|nr:Csp1 family four helix bundle copper storage protein [Deltaproteobacteria bacterium]